MYAQILRIASPWSVTEVELKLSEEQAGHVYLEHEAEAGFECLECALHTHQPEQRWWHLDSYQYQTILHAAPPRTNCPEHGAKVRKLPWAGPSSRFTALFEKLVIGWLKASSQSAVKDHVEVTCPKKTRTKHPLLMGIGHFSKSKSKSKYSLLSDLLIS